MCGMTADPVSAPAPGRRIRRFRRRRGVEMLPTLVTLGNLFCGMLAIAYLIDAATLEGAARHALHERAVILIFLAMVFDGIDGTVARMTGSATRFGAELDSICDAVSFGLAPALLFKVVIEADPALLRPKAALILAAVYVACSVLRLARFNVTTASAEGDHRWFQGLPTPAAAAAVASLVFLNGSLDSPGGRSPVRYLLIPTMAGLAFLMVSRVRYLHVASWLFRRKRRKTFVLILFGTALAVLYHEFALPVICIAFVLSGPLFSRLIGRPRV
jgi:CDP-diacylglycerol--serine O-phosphatidyltransferase